MCAIRGNLLAACTGGGVTILAPPRRPTLIRITLSPGRLQRLADGRQFSHLLAPGLLTARNLALSRSEEQSFQKAVSCSAHRIASHSFYTRLFSRGVFPRAQKMSTSVVSAEV